MALIEYARNVCHLDGAHSTGWSDASIIALITEWQTADGAVEQRSEESDGWHHALGAQPCRLVTGTKTQAIYNADEISGGTGILMR